MKTVFVYPALYTPSEAARITGCSQEKQRDWRRRGFLPASPWGHARFTWGELFTLAVMQELSGFDMGPSHSIKLAAAAAETRQRGKRYLLWFGDADWAASDSVRDAMDGRDPQPSFMWLDIAKTETRLREQIAVVDPRRVDGEFRLER